MTTATRPVYCQFLDREMAASVGYSQSASKTACSLLLAMMATSSFCYSSLSVIGESPGIQKRSDAVKIALDSGKFQTISDMPSADEFLHSRRQMFGFDQRRFPAYFRKYSEWEKLALFTPSITKPTGTTDFLAEYLLGPEVLVPHVRSSVPTAVDIAHNIIAHGLSTRENEAIIFSLFKNSAHNVGDLSPYVSAGIRRTISAAYGSNMVRSMGGTILTGVERLAYYDELLLKNASAIPIGTLYALLSYCSTNFVGSISAGDVNAWREAVNFLLGPDGDSLAFALCTQYEHMLAEAPGLERRVLERSFHAEVRRICRSTPIISADWRSNVMLIADNLLGNSAKATAGKGAMIRLLITYANEREYLGILDSLQIDPDSMGDPVFGSSIAYDRLPDRNGVEMFLVQSETGSGGAGGSQATIYDAIAKLRPTLVAAVGVGFALIDDPDVDGTVLIATRARSYERVRLGTNKDGSLDLRERGEARDVDPIELQRLRMVARRAKVKFEPGEIVSGEKLVDWRPFRMELKERFPDAVGGDQELAGIVAACARKKVPWVFLKAVSDRGDGKKKARTSVTVAADTRAMLTDDERQRAAARKAMDIFSRYIDALSTIDQS